MSTIKALGPLWLILAALLLAALGSVGGWLLMVEHEPEYEQERSAPIYVRTQDPRISQKE
jgi:hypothetical protein